MIQLYSSLRLSLEAFHIEDLRVGQAKLHFGLAEEKLVRAAHKAMEMARAESKSGWGLRGRAECLLNLVPFGHAKGLPPGWIQNALASALGHTYIYHHVA